MLKRLLFVDDELRPPGSEKPPESPAQPWPAA